MLYGVVDTVLTGHASATDLAAMGLGTGVYSSVFVTLLGVLNALNPIIGQHHGGGRHTAIGVSYVQGLWLALLLSIAGGLFLAFPGPWLGWIHAPPDVEAVVTRYLLVVAAAMPAALMFRVISALNIAVARPHVVMRMQVAGLALKVVLSYGLIFGALGLPRLGAVGGALASAIVFWALFAAGWTHTRLDPFYHRFAIRRAVPRWSVLREQVQLGVPMGLSYAIEATSFTFITLLVARLGTSVMAGHQIVANLAAPLLHGPALARGRHRHPDRPRDRRGGRRAGATHRGHRDPHRPDRGGVARARGVDAAPPDRPRSTRTTRRRRRWR